MLKIFFNEVHLYYQSFQQRCSKISIENFRSDLAEGRVICNGKPIGSNHIHKENDVVVNIRHRHEPEVCLILHLEMNLLVPKACRFFIYIVVIRTFWHSEVNRNNPPPPFFFKAICNLYLDKLKSSLFFALLLLV